MNFFIKSLLVIVVIVFGANCLVSAAEPPSNCVDLLSSNVMSESIRNSVKAANSLPREQRFSALRYLGVDRVRELNLKEFLYVHAALRATNYRIQWGLLRLGRLPSTTKHELTSTLSQMAFQFFEVNIDKLTPQMVVRIAQSAGTATVQDQLLARYVSLKRETLSVHDVVEVAITAARAETQTAIVEGYKRRSAKLSALEIMELSRATESMVEREDLARAAGKEAAATEKVEIENIIAAAMVSPDGRTQDNFLEEYYEQKKSFLTASEVIELAAATSDSRMQNEILTNYAYERSHDARLPEISSKDIVNLATAATGEFHDQIILTFARAQGSRLSGRDLRYLAEATSSTHAEEQIRKISDKR